MKPTKIMILRHAEKPGTYGGHDYAGINEQGVSDTESLVTLGWQRAGGIANLICPTYGALQNPNLAKPDIIYTATPGTIPNSGPSKRPSQTISVLAAKGGISIANGYAKDLFASMVEEVLTFNVPQSACTVLISWEHDDILSKKSKQDSIVKELLQQTGTTGLARVPKGPWPGDRYDMIFVLDRPSGIGAFTGFTQVPQMLLAGDIATPIP